MTPRRKTAQGLRGNELAHALKSAGMKSRRLAESMHVVPLTVSQWFTGRRKPHLKDVQRIEESWAPTDTWGVICGAQAIQVLSFQSLLVPGLLQTESYARAVLSNEEEVESPLTRQKILDGDDPLILVVVLDESVLHRKIGDAAVMYEQYHF